MVGESIAAIIRKAKQRIKKDPHPEPVDPSMLRVLATCAYNRYAPTLMLTRPEGWDPDAYERNRAKYEKSAEDWIVDVHGDPDAVAALIDNCDDFLNGAYAQYEPNMGWEDEIAGAEIPRAIYMAYLDSLEG